MRVRIAALSIIFCMLLTQGFCQTITGTEIKVVHPTLGENGDNIRFYRVDANTDYGRLRLSLGDEEYSDFEIGHSYYLNGEWRPTFYHDGFGNTWMKGNLGLGVGAYSLSKIHAKSPAVTEWGVIVEAFPNRRVIGLGHDGTNGIISVGAMDGTSGFSPLEFRTSNVSQMIIGADGNVGIGTATPVSWFGGKVLEMVGTRPVLKLSSSSSTGHATILFTNSSINSSTHIGEFHLNHSFNSSAHDQSKISFASYPAGASFEIRADGHIAIGDNKQLRLRNLSNVETALAFDGPTETVRLSNTKDGYDRFIALGGYSGSTWTQQLTVNTKTGQVGIGTTSPDQKLTVKGKIHAEEVIIDLSVPAPDYVFEQNYSLTPLDEVQAYIAQHKHLPEVPSAKEMEKDGLKVGEMEMILLKKIEELTLYIIDLKAEKDTEKMELLEKIERLEKTVKNLKN
jgi:hypothetical protein